MVISTWTQRKAYLGLGIALLVPLQEPIFDGGESGLTEHCGAWEHFFDLSRSWRRTDA
jgi:hypothetical protein